MLLKYLDIQGFKSFPDKTRIAFGKGLTAVVGPNGSGKSNISDAVRWVMGEQSTKTLRGSKMEDVIFAGTKLRKSQGFAEVSLTFDNSERVLSLDSDEVTITRRYDRSGESEYMINRSTVRLKDLQEFLMDTGLGKDGYSMVGQGKIAEVVQSKSNERREIFEEAAGISKYRYKKNESERSLIHAQENLVRLLDILSELEGRVGPLKEQSEKAKKYLLLSQEKRRLEISLWIETLNRSNRALKDQEDKILAVSISHEETENRIKELEDGIQKAFVDMQGCLVLNESLRGKKEESENGISELNSLIAVCQNNITHNAESISRLAGEIDGHQKTGADTSTLIARRNEKITELNEELDELLKSAEKIKEKLLATSTQNDGATQKEKELSDEINRLLLEESKQKMTVVSSKMGIDELSEALSSFEAEDEKAKLQLSSFDNELADSSKFLTELEEKSNSLQNTYSGHKLKLESRMKKLDVLKTECGNAELSVKEREQKVKLLEGMEQSLEGFYFSVKEVIKLSKNGALKGILGTVSQVIEVNEEYSLAIETALGGAMQNIVVESETDAKTAIRTLKQGNLGRATFLPLTSVGTSATSGLFVSGLDRYAGYIGIAQELVKCDSIYNGVISSLLSRVVVVEDIDTAVLIAQKNGYKFKIVTLDGQVVNAGGSLTGGSKNKGQSFLSRKNEIAELKLEIISLSKKHIEAKERMISLDAEVSKIGAEATALLSEITTVNEDTIRVAGECKRVEQLLMQLSQTVAKMNSEQNARLAKKKQLDNAMTTAEYALQTIKTSLDEKNREILEVLQISKSHAENKTTIADHLSEVNIKEITIRKDIEATQDYILQMEKRQQETGDLSQRLTLEIDRLKEKNAAEEEDITLHEDAVSQKKLDIAELQRQMEETVQKRQELEGSTTAMRKEEREISNQKESLATEMARLEEKKTQIRAEYDSIITKLWDEYELTRSEANEAAEPVEDTQKASNELNSLRSKIRALGSVNVDAIEEYKEVSERYEFLKNQISDVEKSRNELQRLINELTQKMQDIFSENFEKINRYFQLIFVELFGGGSASLKLTDPENVLDSGIDIFVEPPGKIIKNLASLSGGEQALVAIAIYFAIFKVRPAPFCILDEIEAALDDVNVDKYASYLRSISDSTQFIMITHRRGSMEAADVLYGVTMQDEGVSKLLELNVAQIEQKLNIKL